MSKALKQSKAVRRTKSKKTDNVLTQINEQGEDSEETDSGDEVSGEKKNRPTLVTEVTEASSLSSKPIDENNKDGPWTDVSPNSSKPSPLPEPTKTTTPPTKISCAKFLCQSFGRMAVRTQMILWMNWSLVCLLIGITIMTSIYSPRTDDLSGNLVKPTLSSPFSDYASSWQTITETDLFRFQMAAHANHFVDLYYPAKKPIKGSDHPDVSPYMIKFFSENNGKNVGRGFAGPKRDHMIKVPWEELRPNATIFILNQMTQYYYKIKSYQQQQQMSKKDSILPKDLIQPFCFVDLKWSHIGIDKSILRNRIEKTKNGDHIDPENPKYKAFDFIKERAPEPEGQVKPRSEEREEECGTPDTPRCYNNEDIGNMLKMPPVKMIPYMPLIMLDEHILPTASYGRFPTHPKTWIQTPLFIYVTKVSDCAIEGSNEFTRDVVTMVKREPVEYSTYKKNLRAFLKMKSIQKQQGLSLGDYDEDYGSMYDSSEEDYEKLANMMTMVSCRVDGHIVNYNTYQTKISFILTREKLQKFAQCTIDNSELKTIQDLLPKQQS